MLFMGLLMLFTLHMMAKSAKVSGVETYENLGWHSTFGYLKRLRGFLNVNVLLMMVNIA